MAITDEKLRLKVWNDKIIQGEDPKTYRQDANGAWMKFDETDRNSSELACEVDHICPESLLQDKKVSQELIDDPYNLQPLNWHNNAKKSDSYPHFTYEVTADNSAEGHKNIKKLSNRVWKTRTIENFDKFFGCNTNK